MPETLYIRDLSLSYNRRPVVSNLNGEFRSGSVNLVVGRAGSGKSSLLLTIAGFHKEYTGTVSDKNGLFSPAGNFSLAFQNPESLFFNASVGEEIGFALKMRGKSEDEISTISRNWLARWGLNPEEFFNKHPLELSGGEKRRVALAACTVFMPPVILLDEPLAGLDARGQLALARLLHEIALNHIVIVVTHEPEIFLEADADLLFLREQSGVWMKGLEFIRAALDMPEFYPLPDWYVKAVGSFKGSTTLPAINAHAVAGFLEKVGKNADQL